MNFAELTDLLDREIAPLAQGMDHDPALLAQGLDRLCDAGLMALRRPVEFGGPAWSEPDFRVFQEEVARRSGALAFLQTQHQSSVAILTKSSNEGLRADRLPRMHRRDSLIGLGFSQLRRPGPPITTAEEVPGGYRLKGHVPWITGFGLFSEWLVAAQLPDGRAVFGLLPLEPGPGMTFSEPMQLCAMQAAQTVTADLEDVLLPAERVVFVKRPGWIRDNDMLNITLQGWFALGCARAGLDQILAAHRRRGSEFLVATEQALEAERQECRKAMARADDPTEIRLQTRAWGIDLAVRCAHAGVVANSGFSNSMASPAQRIFRESLVFSVSAQTSEIMEATLRRSVRPGG
ncbi:MAG: acyl-CoA/acyl-ACP dehydrogenase [Fimbriimonadaceae bacterium]|nr:acyl-CoA/acyl-ACP dehydrogenase [Fimbriimonadaceae bacterium]